MPMDKGVTGELARFVVETGYADLPKQVVKESKRAILDWLGSALGGSKEPLTRILVATAKEMGGKRMATVLGNHFKTSALTATLINGAMSHALDYDDVYFGGRIHPSAPMLPAILAVAESQHLTGKDVIAAYVLGFEVEGRIGQISGNPLIFRNWHTTACLGNFCAAACAGNLIVLTP